MPERISVFVRQSFAMQAKPAIAKTVYNIHNSIFAVLALFKACLPKVLGIDTGYEHMTAIIHISAEFIAFASSFDSSISTISLSFGVTKKPLPFSSIS